MRTRKSVLVTLCLERAFAEQSPVQSVGGEGIAQQFAFEGLSLGFGLEDLRRL